jgi:hypothetical protein
MSLVQQQGDTDPSPLAGARELLAALRAADVTARALGGIAVAMRCPSALRPPLAREYHDLDLVTTRGHARDLGRVLAQLGYEANARFNALHGRTRLIFAAPDGTHLDVLVGEFAMCHRLDLSARLTIDEETLTLADLSLTKLQIAELNRKDAQDVLALLVDHPLTEDDTGINGRYVAGLLGRDWGWWRTATANLDLLARLLPTMALAESQRAVAEGRLADLRERIDGSGKTLGWKARAKLGDRVPWRSDPEELAPG